MPNGFALTDSATGEIFAYTGGRAVVDAVSDTPGWTTIGAFFMPFSIEAMLEIIGFVSDPALTLRARVFDLTTAAVVSGSTASTTASSDARARSGVVAFVAGHLYQVQAEVIGDSGAGLFGVVETHTLSN